MSSNPAPSTLSGLLLVNKPAGISSFDIIRKLRRRTDVRKMGHAGTLDPAATGLMLMLVGAATKQAAQLTKLDKTYRAELTLGATSSTGDAEGELTPVSDTQPTLKVVTAALQQFQGDITQIPSAYSAIKVNGVRAYKLAREGKEVTMPPREVTVHSIELLSYAYPVVTFEASVSSGTYIRSLGQDIGDVLGTGGYLTGLCRTACGTYNLSAATNLDAITAENLPKLLTAI